MKNIVKNFDIIPAKIPNMHGHTKIELRDKAGAKKVIESDNTFQTAVLADYMRSLGIFGNSPFSVETWRTSFWQNLVGGLYLFRDTITTGTEYMPAGNLMVGNGSYGVSNSGTPTELGSYNSTESSAGNSSIIQVYDFSTSQANGTIGCACLGGQVGGYIGYGNASGGIASTLYAPNKNQSSNSLSSVAVVKDYTYTFTKSGQTLTVNKTPRAMETASVFNAIGTSSTDFTLENTGYQGDGLEYTGSQKVDGEKIYLFPINADSSSYYADGYYGAYASGATIYYIVYDTETDTLEEKTLVNNTEASVRIYNNFCVVSDYLFAGTKDYYGWTTSPVYVIDMTDGSVYDELAIGTSGSVLSNIGKLAPGLMIYGSYVYDLTNKTLYQANINNGSGLMYNDSLDAIEYGSIYMYKNPLYLATINNLDESVTKDSSMTMKVTYSLTTA